MTITPQSRQAPLKIDVISIQSQVIYGCVGNNAAVPTLQQYGLTVASVPTVLFSNTPHYPTKYGDIIPLDWFSGFLRALEERRALTHARAIILGYLGDAQQAQILSDWLSKIRAEYPDMLVQIDPVLGDIDVGLYVKPELAAVYRDALRHQATGMTPNHYELEFLTQRKIHTLDETIAAAQSLLSDTTQWIIATSAAPKQWQQGQMSYVIVSKTQTLVRSHPYLHTDAKGTGDTFAAALTAQLLQGKTLEEAAEIASARVIDVIERTRSHQVNELMLIDTP